MINTLKSKFLYLIFDNLIIFYYVDNILKNSLIILYIKIEELVKN